MLTSLFPFFYVTHEFLQVVTPFEPICLLFSLLLLLLLFLILTFIDCEKFQ